MATKTIEQEGYLVRFRIRTMKKRKRAKGRARGFYEGSYVFVRARGPDGVVRDHYLGTSTESVTRHRKPREEKAAAPATSASSSSRKRQGKKEGDSDTRDPHDDRTRPMRFDSPRDDGPGALAKAMAKYER